MPEVVPPQTAVRRALLAVVVVAALAGCQKTTTATDSGTTGAPNICNAQSDAQTEPACQLTLGTEACFYLDHKGKELWLQASMPATLNAQSLLTIEAGYQPSEGSPVELSLNVVTASQAAIASGQNLHDPGAPGPINITTTPATALAGQPIFLIFSDATGTHFDIHSKFCVTANVAQDNDPNQAGVPTQITLASANGVEANTPPAPGVLSTPGRVDEYAFTVDPSIPKPILYLSVVVPPNPDGGILSPPIAYLMGYTLYDCGPSASASATTCAGNPPKVPPEGSIAASDHMSNVFLPVNLSTAILVKSGELYVIEVAGVNANQGDKNTVPGDIRFQYGLTIEELPDLDPYDGPNPTPVSPSLGGAAVTLSSGRLSYVPQIDSFAINLPSQAVNTRIHYVITPGTSGTGRFPVLLNALGVPSPRITELSIPVPASPGIDPGQACNDDYDTCPTDTDNLTAGGPAIGLPEQFCELDGGPQCLYSYRQEDPAYASLSNFEGIIPVKAGTTVANLQYEWQGGQGADDVPYTLAITWLNEGPENQTPPYHWSQTTAINGGTLGASTSVNGAFTLGDSLTDNSVQTVRGINDYDAIPSTLDVYQFNFPSISSAAYGATWDFQFSVQNSAGGMPPVTPEFAPFFCDASNTPQCDTQQAPDPFAGLQMFYYNNSGGTWYGQMANAWSQTTSGGDTVDTILPGACWCFQPSYLTGGMFYLYVIGVNRTSYVDSTYTLTMGISTYPGSNGDGGTCPATPPDPDAGTPAVGCGLTPSSCSGRGSQCIANGGCCSNSCNTTTPCQPDATDNKLPDGGFCSYMGGFCE